MTILAFVLALLLLAGTVDPERGWLITLVVLTGIPAMRLRFWRPLDVRPALDVRLAAFVLAILLLAGTVDATRDWLIALAAVTGVAAFMPRLISLEDPHRERAHRAHFRRIRRARRQDDWDWDAEVWR